MATYIEIAAVNLERAQVRHNQDSRKPRETMVLSGLAKKLRQVAHAVRREDFESAALLYRRISVLRPGQLLAEMRKSQTRSDPKKMPTADPSEGKAVRARNNGRLRPSPTGHWRPFYNEVYKPEPDMSWQKFQAIGLLVEIRKELKEGIGISKALIQLINHKVSVRIEREAAKLLLEPEYVDIRKQMPLRWQPRSYYFKTPRAMASRLSFLQRKIRKAIKPGTEFYVRFDRDRPGAHPLDFGPFTSISEMKVGPGLLHESEILFRQVSAKTWTSAGVRLFKPRARYTSTVKAEYEAMCRRHGKGSSRMVLWAWEVLGHRPSSKDITRAKAELKPGDPLLKKLLSLRKRIPIILSTKSFDRISNAETLW